MTKTLLSAAGAFALMAAMFTSAAQAQCWWTGFGYSCAAPPVAAYQAPTYYQAQPPYWGSPYAAWSSWDYRDYRYKPDWLPSYPGPKPSGGGGFGL